MHPVVAMSFGTTLDRLCYTLNDKLLPFVAHQLLLKQSCRCKSKDVRCGFFGGHPFWREAMHVEIKYNGTKIQTLWNPVRSLVYFRPELFNRDQRVFMTGPLRITQSSDLILLFTRGREEQRSKSCLHLKLDWEPSQYCVIKTLTSVLFCNRIGDLWKPGGQAAVHTGACQ